jgi:methyl-accepting chemotaxis protein
MLNRLSVKGRMYIINLSILVLFVTMVLFSVRNSNGVKDLGIRKNRRRDAGRSEGQDSGRHPHGRDHDGSSHQGCHRQRNKRWPSSATWSIKSAMRADKSRLFSGLRREPSMRGPAPEKRAPREKILRELNPVKTACNDWSRGCVTRPEPEVDSYHYVWPKPGAGDTRKLTYAEMIPRERRCGSAPASTWTTSRYTRIRWPATSNRWSPSGPPPWCWCRASSSLPSSPCACSLPWVSSGRLKEMVVSFRDIAEGEGDLTKRIAIDSKDEIAELAGWFNTFLAKAAGR